MYEVMDEKKRQIKLKQSIMENEHLKAVG